MRKLRVNPKYDFHAVGCGIEMRMKGRIFPRFQTKLKDGSESGAIGGDGVYPQIEVTWKDWNTIGYLPFQYSTFYSSIRKAVGTLWKNRQTMISIARLIIEFWNYLPKTHSLRPRVAEP